MSERFLYSVFPKMLIKDLPGVAAFRSNKSLHLTKDEVKLCLKHGSVYRRFANEDINEKVTLSNLDRLHNSTFMTVEDYEEFKKRQVDSNRGQFTASFPTSSFSETLPKEKEDDSLATEETPVEAAEEKTVDGDDELHVEEVTDNKTDDSLTTEETPVEAAEEKEEISKENNQNKNNYQSKKKRK